MQTHSGILKLTKTEKKEIELLLEHAKRDLGYLEGGTYCTVDELFDIKSAEKAKRAIENIYWILDRF